MIEEGNGAPVVLLHGNPDNATEWNRVIDVLSPKCRCIAFDLPGFGESPEPPKSYDFCIESQARFLDSLLKELRLQDQKIVLVAHDIGAVMALGWAVDHVDRVKGLAICNAVFSTDYSWHMMARIWSTPMFGTLFMLSMSRWAFKLGMKMQFPTVPEEEADRMYSGITPAARHSIVRLYREMTEKKYFTGWETRFQEIGQKVPTVVIWGAADRLIPRRFAERFSGRVCLLEGVNHWTPLEAPQAVADEIRKLL